MCTKEILGILPLILAVPSYAYYIHTVFKKKTVPNMYSWLIWSVLAGIGYIAQLSANAGPGAWNTGMTAVICFAVFLISVKHGDRKLSKLDAALLVLSVMAIATRLVTGDYVLAVLLTTCAALIGFALTTKKAYKRPQSENATTFFLNGVRNLISLFALSSVSFVTFFYPISMMLANFTVTATVLSRRKQKQ